MHRILPDFVSRDLENNTHTKTDKVERKEIIYNIPSLNTENVNIVREVTNKWQNPTQDQTDYVQKIEDEKKRKKPNGQNGNSKKIQIENFGNKIYIDKIQYIQTYDETLYMTFRKIFW